MHISTVSPSKFASEPWPFKDEIVYEPLEPAPQVCVCMRMCLLIPTMFTFQHFHVC